MKKEPQREYDQELEEDNLGAVFTVEVLAPLGIELIHLGNVPSRRVALRASSQINKIRGSQFISKQYHILHTLATLRTRIEDQWSRSLTPR